MVHSESLFWIVWRSLDGREQSTLHPPSVPAVIDNVDERLLGQYKSIAASYPPQPEDKAALAFCQSLLRPEYRFASQLYDKHAAVSPLLPEDGIGCRSLAVRSPQNTSDDCSYNILVMTQLERFAAYEYNDSSPPSYEATANEHDLLFRQRGERQPNCLFWPRPATRKLMRLVHNLVDPTLAIR